MRRVRRRGFSLPELLISITVLSAALALATHIAMGQLRLLHGVAEVTALRSQTGHATGIAGSLFWSMSPAAGDLLVAQDSAVEFRVGTGLAAVCSAQMGRLVIPAPDGASGGALASFSRVPAAGDRVAVLFADSLGLSWLTLRVSAAQPGSDTCPLFPGVSNTWGISLVEQVVVQQGAMARFSRPMRLSLYRASDGQWFLGARDWNGGSGQFNGIQPLAGPLRPYSPDEGRSGLSLRYFDAVGGRVSASDLTQVARITVVARSATRGPVRVPGLAGGSGAALEDSSFLTIALRNRP